MICTGPDKHLLVDMTRPQMDALGEAINEAQVRGRNALSGGRVALASASCYDSVFGCIRTRTTVVPTVRGCCDGRSGVLRNADKARTVMQWQRGGCWQWGTRITAIWVAAGARPAGSRHAIDEDAGSAQIEAG